MFFRLNNEVLNYINTHIADYGFVLIEHESTTDEGEKFYTYETKLTNTEFVSDCYIQPTEEFGAYLTKLLEECGVDYCVAKIYKHLHFIGFGESDEQTIRRIKKEMAESHNIGL